MTIPTRLLVAAVLLVAAPQATAGQTLERDPATGHYRLTYTDLDGETHTVQVQAADRITPALSLDVDASSGAFNYRYTLANEERPESQDAITWLDLPCPDGEMSTPAGWFAIEDDIDGGRWCHFKALVRDLTPGRAVAGLTVVSGWRPVLGVARVAGALDYVLWPSLEGTVPEEVYELAHSVQGVTGGWVEIPAVLPGIAPDAVGTPTKELARVASQLGTVCQEPAWITHRGVCRSLQAKLDAAGRAIDRGRTSAARGSLQSFLNQLDAQHGDTPGKHINDNAYWLLRINAEHLVALLPGA